MSPERLYLEIGRLIAQSPELAAGPITPEMQRWLASASDLVKASGSLAETVQFAVACENLDGPLRDRNAQTIVDVLHRVLAKAEESTARELRGSVLLIDENLDAYRAVRQLLGTASSDALIVEPDAGGKVLADYAILAPVPVTVRLLADEAQYKDTLIAGVERWQRRFGDHRKLIVRLASPNTIHERVILLDGERAWVSGVPFSSLARRTRSTLVRMSPEEEVRKIAIYSELWEIAEPL